MGGLCGHGALQIRMDAETRIRYDRALATHCLLAKTIARTPNFFNTMQVTTVAASTGAISKDLPTIMVARQMFTNNRILV